MALAWLRWLHVDVYAMLKARAERRMWRKAFPKDGKLDEKGICIAVNIRSLDSVAQVGRDLIGAMARTTISYTVFDRHVRYDGLEMISDEQVQYCIGQARDAIRTRNVLIVGNGPMQKDGRFVNAITPFWEFDSGFPACGSSLFNGVQHVVTFSDFCRDYFKRIAPKSVRVHKVRYPYAGAWRRNESRNVVRARFGIPDDAFAVFFHFNCGSSCARKNPMGALKAFLAAFPQEPRARLVLKVACAAAVPEAWRLLNDAITPFKNRVTLIDGSFSRQQILDLVASSDVYMSLHRGEGFGIGMLEAMAMGTPVVCTNYGGNTDFCKPETAFLVGYKMVPNDSDKEFFASVENWPEPDIDAAAVHLRNLFGNPVLGCQKAQAAKAFIDDYFSIENFEKDMRAFLSALT